MVTKNKLHNQRLPAGVKKSHGKQAKIINEPDDSVPLIEPTKEEKPYINLHHEMQTYAERLLGLGLLRADVCKRLQARFGVGKDTADGLLNDIRKDWRDWYWADKEERMATLDQMIRTLINEGYEQKQLGVVAVGIRRLMDLHGIGNVSTVGNNSNETNKVTSALIFGESINRSGDEREVVGKAPTIPAPAMPDKKG